MTQSFADLLAALGNGKTIKASRAGDHIGILKLNRAGARNAINADLTRELSSAVAILEADPGIRVGILSGCGENFCAGADLKEVAAGRLDDLFTLEGGLAGFTHAQRQKPWVAAVEGAAYAGGFELVLSCDMVVASVNAHFALPEVKRGLIASAGGVYRLPRSIPKKIALEMIATGEPIDAQRAVALGIVNRLTAPGHALNGSIQLAQLICANAPLAVEASLAIARKANGMDEDALYELGGHAQQKLQATSDYLEGSRAFLEKRRPVWRSC